MRPRYETPEDRSRERQALRRVAHSMGFKSRPTPPFSVVDGEVADTSNPDVTRLIAVAEVKCRYVMHDRFPELLISKAKIENGLAFAKSCAVEYWLIIQWLDKTGWTKIESLGFKTAIGGRSDRFDRLDKEWCYLIPIAQFTMLEVPLDAAQGL